MARIEEASLPYDHLVGLSMLIYVQKDVESGQIIDSRCARIIEDMQLTEHVLLSQLGSRYPPHP